MRLALRSLLLCTALTACLPAYARFEPVTCHNEFTQQQEIDEGQKVALKIYQQKPVLPENDPVSVYVRHIGERLLAAAPLTPGLTRQWPFSFHVVASSEINAFALPGGATFVNLGAIQAAETEAQLAGVMAHEMSHVLLRHSTCNMAQQEHRSLLYSLGEIGSSIFLGNSAIGSLATAGLGMGQKLDFLHMSRGDEKQADLLGVNILSNAGYDPRGLAQFFEIIRSKTGNGGAQFLSDHPNPGNRTEYVDAEIRTLPPRTAETTINTPEFRRIHAVAGSERTFTAQQVADGVWKRFGGYISGPGQDSRGADSYNPQSQGNPQQPAAPPAVAAVGPLSLVQLGLGDRFTMYQAARWSIAAPASWTRTQDHNASNAGQGSGAANPAYDQNGQAAPTRQANVPPAPSVLIAPLGASGSFGIAYGVIVSIAQVGGNGVQNQDQLSNATTQLLQNLLAGQPGLAQSGGITNLQVGGHAAESVDLRGISPVGQNGTSDAEHDWMVTVVRPDGDVSVLIFVAPQAQFGRLQPTFERMLQSFHPQ